MTIKKIADELIRTAVNATMQRMDKSNRHKQTISYIHLYPMSKQQHTHTHTHNVAWSGGALRVCFCHGTFEPQTNKLDTKKKRG